MSHFCHLISSFVRVLTLWNQSFTKKETWKELKVSCVVEFDFFLFFLGNNWQSPVKANLVGIGVFVNFYFFIFLFNRFGNKVHSFICFKTIWRSRFSKLVSFILTPWRLKKRFPFITKNHKISCTVVITFHEEKIKQEICNETSK